jgi:hypothetical protein
MRDKFTREKSDLIPFSFIPVIFEFNGIKFFQIKHKSKFLKIKMKSDAKTNDGFAAANTLRSRRVAKKGKVPTAKKDKSKSFGTFTGS